MHPLLDGDADRVGHREDLGGAEPDGAVRRDAAQLAVDLLERDPRAQGERDRRGHRPPALPSDMKTSNGWPLSSSVIVTYIVPNGDSTRRVEPLSRSGRDRLARRCRFSASTSCSCVRVRSSSVSSSAMRPSASASATWASLGAALTFFAVVPVDRTWFSRAPSRYTVTPLQPKRNAIR